MLWSSLGLTLFTGVTYKGSGNQSTVTILTLQIHHIIADGWSLQILLKELESQRERYRLCVLLLAQHQVL